MKFAMFLAPFGELAEPMVMAKLASTAEASGWDGLFLWDHILRPAAEVEEVGDVWTSLTVAALSTKTLLIGPMVTPINRRRPQVVARQSVALDRLSNGRLVLGCGLGVDSGGELSRFGEETHLPAMAQRLDEGLELLTRLWSGETVTMAGDHFVADSVRFVPVPIQRPRIPVWLAARGGAVAPLRRAARYDGLFPIEMDVDQLAAAVGQVASMRGTLDGFDVAVRRFDGCELEGVELDRLDALGVTWCLDSHPARTSFDDALQAVSTPPRRTGSM